MTTAVRQASPGTRQDAGSRAAGLGTHKDSLARGLGVFSLALGVPQVVAPGAFARLVGLNDTRRSRLVMRIVGVRELVAGVAILRSEQPAGWLWGRVAGDAKDLALLGAATALDGVEKRRVAAAAGAVTGAMMADVIAGTRLGRAAPGIGDDRLRVVQAVTVNRPADEVYAFWSDLANLPRFMLHLESVEVTGPRQSRWRAKAPAGRTVEWDAEITAEKPARLIAWRSLPGAAVENAGRVEFRPAPGGRGTEVRVELEYAPPGGPAGAALAKLFGEEPEVQAYDDLRRCKQVLETGMIVRSEGTPEGVGLVQQLLQRAAQPLGGGEHGVSAGTRGEDA